MAEPGWSRQVDGYCERTDFTFWSEPLNAATNAAFVLAALLALVLWWRDGRRDGGALLLIALTTAIGIGSFLFHTAATLWAALADVLPILLFIVSYFVLTLRRWFERPWWLALLLGALYVPAAIVLERLVGSVVGDTLGGSEGYLPALLLLFVCGLWLRALGKRPEGSALLVAAGLFAVSLTFRTIDEPLCGVFPIGTHFVWHVLNGVLLGWLIVAMLRHRGRAGTNVKTATYVTS